MYKKLLQNFYVTPCMCYKSIEKSIKEYKRNIAPFAKAFCVAKKVLKEKPLH